MKPMTFTNAEDIQEARAYAQEIFKANRANRARYACPTCGKADALSSWEHGKGYHCHACTKAAEFGCE